MGVLRSLLVKDLYTDSASVVRLTSSSRPPFFHVRASTVLGSELLPAFRAKSRLLGTHRRVRERLLVFLLHNCCECGACGICIRCQEDGLRLCCRRAKFLVARHSVLSCRSPFCRRRRHSVVDRHCRCASRLVHCTSWLGTLTFVVPFAVFV